MNRLIIRIFIILTFTLSVFANNYKLATDLEPNSSDFKKARAILTEAYKRAGAHTIELVTMPAERALFSANNGIIDGDAARMKGAVKAYDNLIEIEVPITKIILAVYTMNNEINNVTLENIKNFTLIYVRGHKAAERLIKFFDSNKTNISPYIDSSVKMLLAKRAELLIGIESTYDDYIKSQGIKDIIKLEKPLFQSTVHTVLHKKHSYLIPAITKALNDMKKDGTIDKLLKD